MEEEGFLLRWELLDRKESDEGFWTDLYTGIEQEKREVNSRLICFVILLQLMILNKLT